MAAATQRPAPRRGKAIGEHALLAKVRAAVEAGGYGRGVLVGIGDDCAVVAGPRSGGNLVLTTDTMVENVHFEASWLTPRELGVRAYRAAVSDIAAMGARPSYVLLSLEIPGDNRGFGATGALALTRAVAADARRSGATLVGGNVSSGMRTAVTVTVIGETVGKAIERRGAKAGDLVFVTGSLGGASAGWRKLRDAGINAGRSAARASTSAYRRPPLRLDFAMALAERGLAHAMIDVSDGLLQDLGHVADASGVVIRVDGSCVPVHAEARRAGASRRGASRSANSSASRALPLSLELALTGGEDYELAFTAAASALRAVEAVARRTRTRIAVIGFVEQGRPAVTDINGELFAVRSGGFDHLLPSRSKRGGRPRAGTKR